MEPLQSTLLAHLDTMQSLCWRIAFGKLLGRKESSHEANDPPRERIAHNRPCTWPSS